MVGACLALLSALALGAPGALAAPRAKPAAKAATSRAASSPAIDEADKLREQAIKLARQKNLAGAAPLMERVVALLEKALGPDNIEITGDIGSLSQIYERIGEHGRAVALMERIAAIFEKTKGPFDPSLAGVLGELARILDDQGRYDRAVAVEERALSIREKALGPQHEVIGATLHDLAIYCAHAGDYGRAVKLLERALALREKALGKDHPDVGSTLNNLAEVHLQRGDYRRAEPLYQRALAIFEKAFGPEDGRVGVLINNLASLYMTKGELGRAEPLFERALAIREKALGKDHPDVAGALGNLGEVLLRQRKYAAAEPLFQRALAIREQSLGKDHPLTGTSVHNLASLYQEQGDVARAEPLFQRALAIQEKALGKEHPALASTLNNLAVLRQEVGDHAQAERLFSRLIAIQDKALGPLHPATSISLHNLAVLFEAEGKMPEALAALARANEIGEHNIARNLPAGTEEQKLAYMSTLLSLTDSTVSLHLRGRPKSDEAARLALTTILRRKGRVLDVLTGSMAALRRRLSPQDQALFDKLTQVRAEISRAILRGSVGAGASAEAARLEAEARGIEASISERSDEFRAQAEPVTVDRVSAALPQGAALVELFVYAPSDARAPIERRYGPARYAAYVLHRAGKIAAVDLGEASRIEALVGSFRDALSDPKRRDVTSIGRALDELVTRPIRSLLGGARVVLLAPDGALNLVPFGALTDEEGHYLVTRTSFTYLTSGRDLLRLGAAGERRQGALIVANPNFDRADGPPPPRQLALPKEIAGEAEGPARGLAGARFPRLPGTATEAKAIAAILPGALVLSDTRATKAAMESIHGPRILHVATHGFFLEDPPRPKPRAADLAVDAPFEPSRTEARAPNPLLQSGLALAGANAKGGARADGILTALEASGLDLSGTRLVVLSACQTGLGAVKNGNGVYGLRRALVIAGAETQVMSLWQIDDQATRDLMVAYYKDLEAGGGRGEALRKVQLSMLSTPAVAHPYYWASFIVSGDPRSLDGKPVQPSFGKVTPGPRGCGCEVGGQARGGGAWLSLSLSLLALAALRARASLRRPVRARPSATP